MISNTNMRIFEKDNYCLFLSLNIMTKAKTLTKFVKRQIASLPSSGLTNQAIAKKIGRSKTVVNNFVNLNDNYGKRNSRGRLKAFSSRGERTTLRFASIEKYSSMEIIK